MSSRWEPHREPLRTTLLRTGAIAVAIGIALSIGRGGGGMTRLPANIVLALWPAFGGHWVEMLFLNWLRPRLPEDRTMQALARLATWFAAGIVLWVAVKVTAAALVGSWPARWPGWWIGGPPFIAIELIAHLVLQLRGRPSFYNGRG